MSVSLESEERGYDRSDNNRRVTVMLRPQLSHDGDASSTESDKYTEKAVTICRAGSQM